MKCKADNHSLIVTRWSKRDTYEVADHFICQHCHRIFEWDKLVEMDTKARDREILASIVENKKDSIKTGSQTSEADCILAE